ncbi:MAG TPA: hypothetical protein VNZ57_04820 [Longimicrobiales bacterium]|nr:hypothetical protein [Longimicrobiales bacterium]
MDRISGIKLMSLVAAAGIATGCASSRGTIATPDLAGSAASAATAEEAAPSTITAPPTPPPPPPPPSATAPAANDVPQCAPDDEACQNDLLGF